MLNQAHTRVESMLGDARTTAQTVERRSREKATSLAQHATRKHAEILELNQDKSLLETPSLICRRSNTSTALGWQSLCSHCLMSWTGPDPPPRQTHSALNRILLAPGWAHAVKPVNPRPHRDEPDTVETSWEGQPRPPVARVRSCGLMILGCRYRQRWLWRKIWGDLSPSRDRPRTLPTEQSLYSEIHLSSSRRFSPLPDV
jgi:hypothetical protein